MPDEPANSVVFDVDELDERQREALRRLVSLYVDQFGDPGIALPAWST
jgi:hypothetical protein